MTRWRLKSASNASNRRCSALDSVSFFEAPIGSLFLSEARLARKAARTMVRSPNIFQISCFTSKSVPAWPALVNAKFNPNHKKHMKTRNGKIARLPLEIREQLNARLANGEPGNRLADWLNSNPDVIKVMAEQFEGRPITEQCTARKRYFQNVAERSLYRGRSLKIFPNGAPAGSKNGSPSTTSSTKPGSSPRTPGNWPIPAYPPTTCTSCSSPITPIFCRILGSCRKTNIRPGSTPSESSPHPL